MSCDSFFQIVNKSLFPIENFTDLQLALTTLKHIGSITFVFSLKLLLETIINQSTVTIFFFMKIL